jgi:hypothetical protein
MPVYVNVIDHPDGRGLVDTGMTEVHPAVADMEPRISPLNDQDFDLAGIDIVVRLRRADRAPLNFECEREVLRGSGMTR